MYVRVRCVPACLSRFCYLYYLEMCAAVCVAVCAVVCAVGCVADCPQSLCASGLRCVVGCVVGCVVDCAVGCVADVSAGASARRRRRRADVCGGGWRTCAAGVGLPRCRAWTGLRCCRACGLGRGDGWGLGAAGDGRRFGPGCRHLRPRRQGVAACLGLPLRAVGSGRVPSSGRVQPLGARVGAGPGAFTCRGFFLSAFFVF